MSLPKWKKFAEARRENARQARKKILDVVRELANDHYWDSLAKDKQLILDHINAILDRVEKADTE